MYKRAKAGIGYLPQEVQLFDGTIAENVQRIALARALYLDPFLVVLDEPNSNLDSDGEEALTRAISGVRERSGVVIVIAHRPNVLAAVDMLLVLAEGRVQAFGSKTEVLQRVRRPASVTVVGRRS
jgi:ATP-binding cassette subfamily C protein